MITKELKQLVKQEADNLRIHATKEERERLDIEQLDAGDERLCVYGLMTGDCFSTRAAELLNKCAAVYSDRVSSYLTPEDSYFKVSGRAFSPIEFYICQKGANNSGLIAYLREETNELEL